MSLYGGVKEKLGLKEQEEEQAEEEHGEENIENFAAVEHAKAMNDAYKSFRIDGRGKTDIESYIELAKPEVQKLVEEQVKALEAAKVQMHLWVMWKKKEEAVFEIENDEKEKITHEV